MEHKAIVIFTSESIEEIIKQRGTEHWRIDRNKASKHNFVILCRNTKKRLSPNNLLHGSAFLVARLEKVELFSEPVGKPKRWKLFLNEYVSCCVPKVWQKVTAPNKYWRDPVQYSTLEFCNIDLNTSLSRSALENKNLDRVKANLVKKKKQGK